MSEVQLKQNTKSYYMSVTNICVVIFQNIFTKLSMCLAIVLFFGQPKTRVVGRLHRSAWFLIARWGFAAAVRTGRVLAAYRSRSQPFPQRPEELG